MLIKNITFIDSNEFFKGALDTLASNAEDNNFKYLMSEFPLNKLEILKRKEAYLYEGVDSDEKVNYLSLPRKEYFYSSLRDGKKNKNDGSISDEQYLHLQNVSDTFNFNKFEDFQSYLKEDELLLAYVFEEFISTSLRYYVLDPSHYFRTPGLSWGAMLKITKIEWDKISDPDNYIFFEKRIRGGISYIYERYSKANNEYCSD